MESLQIGEEVFYYHAFSGRYTVASFDGVHYSLTTEHREGLVENVPPGLVISKTSGELVQYYDLAYRAHTGTSFSPDKRAFTTIRDYQAQLTEDVAFLTGKGAPAEAVADYTARYKRLFSNWLSAKTNCISTMIAGPANFPVRRAERANRSEETHYKIFTKWRELAQNAIIRKMQPAKTVSSELEAARQKLASREQMQEQMKRINEAHRRYSKNPERFDFTGYTEEEKKRIVSYVPAYSWEPHPFARYQLTNNNAEIKRLRARVAELEAKERRQQEAPTAELAAGNGWRYIENREQDRLQIIFDEKPSEDLRAMLKKHGLKWAPSQNAWQRQTTGNARYVLAQLVKQLP